MDKTIKTAEEFFNKRFMCMVYLVNGLSDDEFKKTLKALYKLMPQELKNSFKEFYKTDTDRKVLNRLYRSINCYCVRN